MPAAGDIIYASDINNLAAKFGQWLTYTPVLYTAMGTTPTVLASTNATGRYKILDDTIFFEAEVTASAASTGGLGMSLPLVSSERWQNIGTAVVMGGGANVWPGSPAAGTVQAGIAYMAADLAKIVIVSLSGGFNIQSASGNTIRASGFYRR